MIEVLKAWIKDLLSGMYVNCVYCGHRYGPGAGADVLHEHVKYSGHPLCAANKTIARLKTASHDCVDANITRGCTDEAFYYYMVGLVYLCACTYSNSGWFNRSRFNRSRFNRSQTN